VFGDFLAAAYRHLDRAAAQPRTSAPGRDAAEIIASLRRLVTALAGYGADLTNSFGELPDSDLDVLNAYARAAVQARDALSGAVSALGPRGVDARPVNGLAREFDDAAVMLLAGRDLLQTHFTPAASRGRRGRTSWAPVIASPTVARALLAEIAELSQRASAAGVAAAPAGRPWPTAELERRLRLSCQWLALAGASGRSTYRQEPVSAAERDLLYAIPSSALAPRRFPSGGEQVPELCAALTTTSERVSHLAWTAEATPPWSPAISATSWRLIASAGTATSHHCHLLLSALADRCAQLGMAGAVDRELKQAAAEARRSRSAWLRAGRALAQVTTDVRWRVSRTAVEVGDLALWSGRLAYASPDWNLSDGPNQPVRRLEDLAPDPEDIPGLVSALHYTTEALERLAASNRQQVRGAARIHRVLMPVSSFPDGSAKLGKFAPAPKHRVTSLLAACREATKASDQTASTVAGIAGEVSAPSRILATAKVAARPSPPADPGRHAAAGHGLAATGPADVSRGPVEARLHGLGVTSPRLLWRASGVDQLTRQLIADAADGSHVLGRSTAVRAARNPRGATASPRPPAAERGHTGRIQRRASLAQQEPEAEP
jgi:hypothetical protein